MNRNELKELVQVLCAVDTWANKHYLSLNDSGKSKAIDAWHKLLETRDYNDALTAMDQMRAQGHAWQIEDWAREVGMRADLVKSNRVDKERCVKRAERRGETDEMPMQFGNTLNLLLDLRGTNEEMYSAKVSRYRYWIRVAQKHGTAPKRMIWVLEQLGEPLDGLASAKDREVWARRAGGISPTTVAER